MRAYLTAMRRYARYSGRTSRDEFWRAHIVFLPLLLLTFRLLEIVLDSRPPSAVAGLIFLFLFLPHVLPWSALVVRRLHDLDRAGWWALVALLPLFVAMPLGVVALLVWAGQAGKPEANRFGPARGDATARDAEPAMPQALGQEVA